MTDEIKKVTINKKEYVESELPIDIKNTIVARSEILTSKARQTIEMENVEVLLNHYNKKIEEFVNKQN